MQDKSKVFIVIFTELLMYINGVVLYALSVAIYSNLHLSKPSVLKDNKGKSGIYK
jgi:hypothetical protein